MAEVSICIPAWQAEGFIERTLSRAAGQTHPDLRILISVDRSTDATARLCQAYAARDPRIAVWVQEARLGWAGNVNFLLDHVQTELFFLYFHDDLIALDYAEQLCRRLQERPDAVGVHCDLGHFGASARMAPGQSYEGSAAQRLAQFLTASHRGPPLRGLTRTDAVGREIRIPTDGEGMWAGEPYLMQLLAAGPITHLGEALYFRWDRRAGGITEDWKQRPPEALVAGLRANARATLEAIDRCGAEGAEREALVYLAGLRALWRLRNVERRLGAPLLAPETLHPAFAELEAPSELASLGREVEAWALERQRALRPSREPAHRS